MQFTTILLIVAGIIGGYILVRVAPAYVNDFQIEEVAKTAAKYAADPSKKDTVNMYLTKQVFNNELPVQAEDFKIEDDGQSATVTIEWATNVAFIPENKFVPPVIRRFAFHHEAVEPIKK